MKGVMGPNCSARIRDITDGTAKTILLAELRAGLTEYDIRGVWALAGAGVSCVAQHGYYGDAPRPNALYLDADDTLGCDKLAATYGGPQYAQKMGMPCFPGAFNNQQGASRSMHTGGVETCFADGSVHFIADEVDVGDYFTDTSYWLGVWDLLNLSTDGQMIDSGAY